MPTETTAHLFISCAPEDEGAVEAIAQQLGRDARITLVTPWDMIPGEGRQEQMEAALAEAQACAVFISGELAGLRGWHSEQMRAAIQARVEDSRHLRVIPVLLPGGAAVRPRDLPAFLRRYEMVVFRSLDDGLALRRLRAGALGMPPSLVDAGEPLAARDGSRPARPIAPRRNDPVALELEIYHRAEDRYQVGLQLSTDASSAYVDLLPGGRPSITLIAQDLLAEALDPVAYGERLGGLLFGEAAIREGFLRAQAAAAATAAPLRLQIRLDPNAPPLHDLRWELLRFPGSNGWMSAGEQVFFSRYLGSEELAPVQPARRPALRALVAVANPDGLQRYGLTPLDVAGEARRAEQGLADIAATIVTRERSGQPVTIEAIVDALRSGAHLLYLVCHGTMHEGVPHLWLEDEQGAVGRIDGYSFTLRIQALASRPLLIILAACESGGAGGRDEALAALGAQLVRAGIPAVLAMQGSVSIDTLATLMPAFFGELSRSGCVDQALASARLAALRHDGWWRPVLYMRLRDGLIFRQ